MNTKFLICVLAAGIAASVLAAAPRVDQETVLLSQAADRTVTVSYVLTGGPGIVTVDFQTNSVVGVETNWVSVGTENFQHVGGDVNCLVTETGVRKTITWRPNLVGAGYQIDDGFRAVVQAWKLDAPPEYMAINLGVDQFVRFFVDASAVPFGVTNEMYKTDWLLMRKIPAANVVWRMGSPLGECGKADWNDAQNKRETPRAVRLTEDFYAAVYMTTRQQHQRIVAGSGYSGDDRLLPKTISWDDLRGSGAVGGASEWPKVKTVTASSVMQKLRNRWPCLPTFDLPTEAQWEYAARGGCGNALPNGTEIHGVREAGTNDVAAVGWCWGTTDRLMPVGLKPANAFGLYDVIGDAWEWCLDWWACYTVDGTPNTDSTVVPGAVYVNPEGPAEATVAGAARSRRGGAYNDVPAQCRLASRDRTGSSSTSYGYRIFCKAQVVVPTE